VQFGRQLLTFQRKLLSRPIGCK